jgi:ORF6N domain
MKTARKRAPKITVLSHPTESLIHIIRGRRVMLDTDLAALYAVPTKALNQAVKRNADRPIG